jgi:NH3-dependent NAD+ synthetase
MVVGINARIDSSIVLSTCAREFDPEWVIGIFPPGNGLNYESMSLTHRLTIKD